TRSGRTGRGSSHDGATRPRTGRSRRSAPRARANSGTAAPTTRSESVSVQARGGPRHGEPGARPPYRGAGRRPGRPGRRFSAEAVRSATTLPQVADGDPHELGGRLGRRYVRERDPPGEVRRPPDLDRAELPADDPAVEDEPLRP